MTATFLPEFLSGGVGTIQPISQPLSTIASSIFLMVTAGEVISKTQEASQGAGHVLPVNSGKLLVL